jgi:hypothetical protein
VADQNREPAQQEVIRTSLRLTFRYSGARIELIDRREVQMIPPPTTGAAPVEGDAGTWLELRDAEDRTLYHRDLRRLMGAEVEVFNPDGSMTHLEGVPGRGQFEVVVPSHPRATSVRVVSSPFEARRMREAATEIARFPLGGPVPGREQGE